MAQGCVGGLRSGYSCGLLSLVVPRAPGLGSWGFCSVDRNGSLAMHDF